MFGSSLASGGKFATSVIGAVAKGDISDVYKRQDLYGAHCVCDRCVRKHI